MMKSFLVLFALMAVIAAHPERLYTSQLPNYQTYTSSPPQQISLLRAPSNTILNLDGHVIDTAETNLLNVNNEEIQRRIQAEIVNQNARNGLRYASFSTPGSGTSSSSSFSSNPFDNRVFHILKSPSQFQQQGAFGINSLLSATRSAQPFSSFIPSGEYSNSRIQVFGTAEPSSIGYQQQEAMTNLRQNQRMSHESVEPLSLQSNGVHSYYGSDRQRNIAPFFNL